MSSSLLKGALYKNILRFRLSTSFMRVLPDFLIIGAQKCGSASLYYALVSHPLVRPASKEIHFFDIHFKKGINWYRSYFPLVLYKQYSKCLRGRDFITGEASPYYLFHPHAPVRVSAIIPQVKLIVLLRNPVDRAYSHYHHEVRHKFETLSFEACIDMEEERLRGEVDRMLKDEHYYSFNHRHFSYLSRGIYVDQLKAWASFFDKSEILVLNSEDFFSNPPEVFNQVLDFLNLPKWQPEQLKRYNTGRYAEIDIAMRHRLHDYFEPHNQRLYQYLGIDFDWKV